MRKKQTGPMYACCVNTGNGLLRSSFYRDLNQAIEYADRSPGIVQIEELGKGVVWTSEGWIKH
jgi:hypothetical protein